MSTAIVGGMTDTRKAPTISTNRRGRAYPDPGTRIGAAWERVWTHLAALTPGQFEDCVALADRIAPAASLDPETVKRLMKAARVAGLLDVTYERTDTGRGPRTRAFYRIRDPLDCPAHGRHPHRGATCLDCPVCRPGAAGA
jgi:hypothetical protein